MPNKTTSFILIVLSLFLIGACARKCAELSKSRDTKYHGYNELANTDKRESFTISDYNTDNPSIKNIARPAKSIIVSDIDTTLLFDIWTSDPKGPHADFVFSKESFLVVDYDGDGRMPYHLKERRLVIYYNDFIQKGDIVSVDKDNLKIKWTDAEEVSSYSRWRN